MGPYGSPSAPTLAQAPRRTRTPRSSAMVASSAARRLLPTPASPATRRCDGAPSAAAASAPRPASSSVRRPMVMGLTRRPAMAAIIGTGAWAGIVKGCAATLSRSAGRSAAWGPAVADGKNVGEEA